MSVVDKILGPKLELKETLKDPGRYWTPKVLFTLAALALMASIIFPYWILNMTAPQYPEGLSVNAYVNRLEGDVKELEGLNHYIGLPSFEDGAQLERSLSIVGILVMGGILLAGLYIHSRWVLVFATPAVVFPLIFIGDLQFWLWRYGHSLDPRAPLSSAVGEFTPPIFGPADIANFTTDATFGLGFILAVIASGLTMAGLWFHRRAFKPLVEAMENGTSGKDSATATDEGAAEGAGDDVGDDVGEAVAAKADA